MGYENSRGFGVGVRVGVRVGVGVELGSDKYEVAPWAKYLGWTLLVLYNCGIGFYVSLFG